MSIYFDSSTKLKGKSIKSNYNNKNMLIYSQYKRNKLGVNNIQDRGGKCRVLYRIEVISLKQTVIIIKHFM